MKMALFRHLRVSVLEVALPVVFCELVYRMSGKGHRLFRASRIMPGRFPLNMAHIGKHRGTPSVPFGLTKNCRRPASKIVDSFFFSSVYKMSDE